MKPCGTKVAGKAKIKPLELEIRLKAKSPMAEEIRQVETRWGGMGCSSQGGKGRRDASVQRDWIKANDCHGTRLSISDRITSTWEAAQPWKVGNLPGIAAQTCCSATWWSGGELTMYRHMWPTFWKFLGEAKAVPSRRTRDMQPFPLYVWVTLGSVWQVLVSSAGCCMLPGGTMVPW